MHFLEFNTRETKKLGEWFDAYDVPILDKWTKQNKFVFSWTQSDDINNKGWITEFYSKDKFKYKKYWTSDWKYKTLKMRFVKDTDNYNFKMNYDQGADLDKQVNDLSAEIGFKPFTTEVSESEFMFRNKWVDPETGQIHYSNYVYAKGNWKDGFKTYEVDGKSLDEKKTEDGSFSDSDIGESRDVNSDIYNGNDASSSKSDADGYLDTFRALSNDLKDFPAFFSNFFDFIPSQYMYALSALLGFAIILAFIRAVI